MTASTMPSAPAASKIKWHILGAVMLGSIMRAFDSDISLVQWVPTVYLLTISCLILLYGRLGDMIGYKKVFLSGLGAFTAASILCGLSQHIWMLITFRAVQGLAAGMMMSPKERGKAMGIYAVSIAVGLSLGPTLGGLIAEDLNWRYVFFVNVPIGIAAIAWGSRIIPGGERKPDQRLDWHGAITALIFLLSLLLFANRGQDWGWFSSPGIIALLITSVIFGAIFLRVETKSAQPMLNLKLFRSRRFGFASLSALLNFMALYAALFLTPFYLSFALHYSILKVGVVMAASPLATLMVAPISGSASDRLGTRGLAVGGMLISTVGLLVLATLKDSSSASDVAWRLAVVGVGIGMFQSPNNSAVMGSVSPMYLGISSGTLAAMRNVGMVLGLAVAGAVLYNVAPVTSTLRPESYGPSQIAEFLHGLRWAYFAGAMFALLSALTSVMAVDKGKLPGATKAST